MRIDPLEGRREGRKEVRRDLLEGWTEGRAGKGRILCEGVAPCSPNSHPIKDQSVEVIFSTPIWTKFLKLIHLVCKSMSLACSRSLS